MTKNITDMTLGYNKIRYRRIHLSPSGDSPLRPLMGDSYHLTQRT